MNKLIIFVCLAAVAYAKPVEQGVSLTQDTTGNYNLRLMTEDVNRDEQGFADGKVIGSYSYTNKDGQHHKITYVAGPNAGFTATGDIPQPVQETPEVAEARRLHLAVVEKERALLPPLKEEPIHEVQEIVYVPTVSALPVHHNVEPVAAYIDNTAELEAAKAEPFAAHQAALAALAAEYKRLAHL